MWLSYRLPKKWFPKKARHPSLSSIFETAFSATVTQSSAESLNDMALDVPEMPIESGSPLFSSADEDADSASGRLDHGSVRGSRCNYRRATPPAVPPYSPPPPFSPFATPNPHSLLSLSDLRMDVRLAPRSGSATAFLSATNVAPSSRDWHPGNIVPPDIVSTSAYSSSVVPPNVAPSHRAWAEGLESAEARHRKRLLSDGESSHCKKEKPCKMYRHSPLPASSSSRQNVDDRWRSPDSEEGASGGRHEERRGTEQSSSRTTLSSSVEGTAEACEQGGAYGRVAKTSSESDSDADVIVTPPRPHSTPHSRPTSQDTCSQDHSCSENRPTRENRSHHWGSVRTRPSKPSTSRGAEGGPPEAEQPNLDCLWPSAPDLQLDCLISDDDDDSSSVELVSVELPRLPKKWFPKKARHPSLSSIFETAFSATVTQSSAESLNDMAFDVPEMPIESGSPLFSSADEDADSASGRLDHGSVRGSRCNYRRATPPAVPPYSPPPPFSPFATPNPHSLLSLSDLRMDVRLAPRSGSATAFLSATNVAPSSRDWHPGNIVPPDIVSTSAYSSSVVPPNVAPSHRAWAEGLESAEARHRKRLLSDGESSHCKKEKPCKMYRHSPLPASSSSRQNVDDRWRSPDSEEGASGGRHEERRGTEQSSSRTTLSSSVEGTAEACEQGGAYGRVAKTSSESDSDADVIVTPPRPHSTPHSRPTSQDTCSQDHSCSENRPTRENRSHHWGSVRTRPSTSRGAEGGPPEAEQPNLDCLWPSAPDLQLDCLISDDDDDSSSVELVSVELPSDRPLPPGREQCFGRMHRGPPSCSLPQSPSIRLHMSHMHGYPAQSYGVAPQPPTSSSLVSGFASGRFHGNAAPAEPLHQHVHCNVEIGDSCACTMGTGPPGAEPCRTYASCISYGEPYNMVLGHTHVYPALTSFHVTYLAPPNPLPPPLQNSSPGLNMGLGQPSSPYQAFFTVPSAHFEIAPFSAAVFVHMNPSHTRLWHVLCSSLHTQQRMQEMQRRCMYQHSLYMLRQQEALALQRMMEAQRAAAGLAAGFAVAVAAAAAAAAVPPSPTEGLPSPAGLDGVFVCAEQRASGALLAQGTRNAAAAPPAGLDGSGRGVGSSLSAENSGGCQAAAATPSLGIQMAREAVVLDPNVQAEVVISSPTGRFSIHLQHVEPSPECACKTHSGLSPAVHQPIRRQFLDGRVFTSFWSLERFSPSSTRKKFVPYLSPTSRTFSRDAKFMLL
ncbi:uncharacterized protein LOC119172939 isoform X2 [Rhipicephalus microplus]|uniref:uncharacterized protein LOC119172939 isoform X2 n=1 Tax=Rhipicephalus microplus TaxID=6941 RepID=UPI003F6CA87F